MADAIETPETEFFIASVAVIPAKKLKERYGLKPKWVLKLRELIDDLREENQSQLHLKTIRKWAAWIDKRDFGELVIAMPDYTLTWHAVGAVVKFLRDFETELPMAIKLPKEQEKDEISS